MVTQPGLKHLLVKPFIASILVELSEDKIQRKKKTLIEYYLKPLSSIAQVQL